MRFFITCDSHWEAKVDKVIDKIDDTGYKKFFQEKDYGSSLDAITVILMCQDSDLNLKQRIRFSKKEKKIYLDLMLDLNEFLKIEQNEKEKIVVEKLLNEIPRIISRYKLLDFDIKSFTTDLQFWMSKIL